MGFQSSSHTCFETNSEQAAVHVAAELLAAFVEHPLKVVLVYATMNHDQPVLLAKLRELLPDGVKLLGCSVQGVVTLGMAREGGFIVGVMGLGGESLSVACAFERDFQVNTREKGKALGAQVKASLGGQPKLSLLFWDPLTDADLEGLLAGVAEELTGPVLGGGAGQPFGRMVRTCQYLDQEVTQHAALMLALSGDFTPHVGVCHGSTPTGVSMTVTRSDGTRLLEIDGQSAIASWREVTGCSDEDIGNQDFASHWAIGVERQVERENGATESMYFVRAAFSFELDHGAVIMPATIPAGTTIMLHHRATSAVLEGTKLMADELALRLRGKQPWAVLGFECGARTSPFLGTAGTLEENLALQGVVAPRTPWLGMMAWGEVATVGGVPTFHNYTYPLVVLTA